MIVAPRLALVVVAVALSAAAPWPGQRARADDGGRSEIQVRGTCTGSTSSQLRIRAEEGRLRIELRLEPRRAGAWTIVLLRERRIAYRGRVHASRGRPIELRRTIESWPGTQTVVARAASRGETCLAAATF